MQGAIVWSVTAVMGTIFAAVGLLPSETPPLASNRVQISEPSRLLENLAERTNRKWHSAFELESRDSRLERPALGQLGIQVDRFEQAQVANSRRVALVIGNADYEIGSPLKNPVNDATDMAIALQELGFDKVIIATNSNLREMETALEAFARELGAGSVGVFFYAGHGMQSEGENYLIPVDANIQIEKDIRHESLPLGKVLARMEDAGNQVNIVILDACRDNPFSRGWRSGGSAGLAEVRAEGVLIAYATAPGDVASDGEGRNGTFTGALLQRIRTPGQDVVLMLRQVRRTVKAKTAGRQVPWVSTSLDDDFAFLPDASASPPIAIAPQPTPQPPTALPPTPAPEAIAPQPTPQLPTALSPTPAPEAIAPQPTPQPPTASPPTPAPEAIAQPPIVLAPETTPQPSISSSPMYAPLERSLARGDWQSADRETASLILKLVGRDRDGFVNAEAIERLGCEQLTEINALWLNYSNRRFGFSVQRPLWERVGGRLGRSDEQVYIQFARQLGWQNRGSWIPNDRLQFSLDAPLGHLPRRFLDGGLWGEFLGHFEDCRQESEPTSRDLPSRTDT